MRFTSLTLLLACLTILFVVPFAAQETQTVLKPNQLITFSLAPEQEKLFVLQMKKGDFADIQWLVSDEAYGRFSFEIYDSARKELLEKPREIEGESFSFVAPNDGDFILLSKLEKSDEISNAQRITLQYNNKFRLPPGTKLKGIRKVHGFDIKIMTTPESDEGSDSVLLIEKNGQLLKAVKAQPGERIGGFSFGNGTTGDDSAEIKREIITTRNKAVKIELTKRLKSIQLINTTLDKTGNGIPDILISFDSGARVGGDEFYIELGETVKTTESCGNAAVGKNPKGGLLFEGQEYSFAMWLNDGCMACARPSFTTVILEFRNGKCRPNRDLMRKPAPSLAVLRNTAESFRHQLSPKPYKGANNEPPGLLYSGIIYADNEDPNDKEPPGPRYSYGIRKSFDSEQPFWDVMIDLIYTGHEELAWQFLDLVWPPQKKGKAIFIRDFTNQLSQSKYWQMILEDEISRSAS